MSPHFGQHGKLDPEFLQVEQHVRTQNFEASSRVSSTECRDLVVPTGDPASERAGVDGPAEEVGEEIASLSK